MSCQYFRKLLYFCTIRGGKKCKTARSSDHILHLKKKQDEDITYFTTHRIKWRHWLLLALLLLVTLTKMIPLWGFLYTTRIYPVIGQLLSPISGIFPFAVGDIFIALSIAWVILYPIYEIGLRKKLARRFIFLLPRAAAIRRKRWSSEG